MPKLDSSSGKSIATAINKKINEEIKINLQKASFNKTKKGIVVGINSGSFDIKIDNALYTNTFALKNVGEINIGDVVICNIPNNQTNLMYIVGVVDGSITPQEYKKEELLYDMTSSDSKINWGYPNGIQADVTVSNLDFTKYCCLTVYVGFFYGEAQYQLNMERKGIDYISGYPYVGTVMTPDIEYTSDFYMSGSMVSNNKTQFRHYYIGYWRGSTSTYHDRNNNVNYYVYKIMGNPY